MNPATLTRSERWRYALKLKSWPKLLVPTLLGQALGAHAMGRFDPFAAQLGAAFTVALVSFIVLLNDWGDQRVDAIKRQMFPKGCSPKTIPDGILRSEQLLYAGLGAGCIALALALASALITGEWRVAAIGGLSLAIFIAYTLPPLRLNYRGGGELLEMVGVGVVLPWYNMVLQGAAIDAGITPILGGYTLLCLASALASGIADEESDRKGGKTTFTTTFGNGATRFVIETLVIVALFVWGWTARTLDPIVPREIWLPPLLLLFWYRIQMRHHSAAALTNAFDAQRHYKKALHSAIWFSTTTLAIELLVLTWYARGFP